ncbi:hypothetical protein ES708_28902 [subsurface metagenome]
MRTKEVKGWGRLPRSLARALAGAKLNVYEGRVVWAIVYKTIAFNKLEDKIPQSQLVDLTGIVQRNLFRTVNSLLKKGVIFRKGNKYGVELDFSKWKNTSLEMYKEKYISGERKYISGDVKNTSLEMDSRDLLKRTNQDRGDFYMKLSRTEIEKLELDQWYQAVMWNYGKFGMEYIEKTMKDYDYNTRMSCWYIYADSGNIRNKEAFFSHLLRNYQEDLKE